MTSCLHGFNKSSLNRSVISLKMRRKVKEKVKPLALAAAEDSSMKALTVVNSDLKHKEFRIKQQFF